MCGNWLKILYFSGVISTMIIADVFAGEQAYVMDEMVVSATKDEKKVFDVAAPMEVVTSGEIEKNTPTTPGQVLQRLPGVSMSTSGIWTTIPTVRGLGLSRTLVLIDGVRESNNIWRQSDPMAPIIDMGEIERIEVIKGPASVLYGTDALGGVINIITKKPSFALKDEWTFSNSAEGLYSSVNEGWYGRYRLSGGGYGFDFMLSAAGRDNDNYEDGNRDDVNNSQFKNQSFDLKSHYYFNPDHFVTLTIRDNEIDDMGVTFKPDSPYFRYTEYDNQTYKLAYDGKNIGFFDSIHFDAFHTEQERRVEGKAFSDAKPMYSLKTSHVNTHSSGVNMHNFINIKGNQRLLTGFTYSHETSNSDETLKSFKIANDAQALNLDFEPIPDAETDLYGIFAQDEIFIGDKTTLTLAVRYDHIETSSKDLPFKVVKYTPGGPVETLDNIEVSDEKFDAFTYNLGLLYALTPNIHLTANANSGFRAPTIMELYAIRWGATTAYYGNPELDPEQSYNFDLGVKLNYQRFRGMFNIYYNQVKDLISAKIFPNDFWMGKKKEIYINIADAELYGFEASSEYDLLEWMTLFGNLAYVTGEDTENDDYLIDIPPLNGLAGVRFHLENGKKKYWLELEAQIFDKQDHTAPWEDDTAGYSVFNIRSGMKLPAGYFENITLTLNVENLFNKQYHEHLKVKDNHSPCPGLNILAGLKIEF
ncbi:hemoglobin/transferrin/lactoferrin receptor protein [Desulfosarcina sp. BuS5]|uniref:TonB-dependent receptor plug domain-containing protein n=2 Tax=Desulfosarcina sp. BuS5 TaxID=933262 RepID=UPI0004877C80|nr:TonB-dependent receptor [Desulfosarcina sp. BuS5]WDN88761.1 hemoglobin/transferrin/lactoferrin receptor protein [Desulfosarcina sp. BuS5]